MSLTAAELQLLRAEIATGPLAAELAPLVPFARDGEIAGVLNARRFTRYGTVLRGDFAVWAGSTGLRSAIEDHAANTVSPLRAISLTLLDFLRGGVSASVDFGRAANRTMLAAFVASGGITQAQADELLAMATVPASRAEIVLGRQVTPGEVGDAR